MSDIEPFDYTKLRPIKFPSISKLQRKISAYFRSCFDYQRDMWGNRIVDKSHPKHSKANPVYVMKQVKPFTVSGLAVFLDTDRATLVRYEKGQFLPENMNDELKQEYYNTIKRAKEQIRAYAEEQLFRPGSATGAIFWLKNNSPDDWKDRHEIDSNENIVIVSKSYKEVEPNRPEPVEAELVPDQPKEVTNGNPATT